MWKTEHTGGPCSPTVNSPLGRTPNHMPHTASGGAEKMDALLVTCVMVEVIRRVGGDKEAEISRQQS